MSHMLSNTSAISPTANTSTSAQYKSHRGWVGLYNDTHPVAYVCACLVDCIPHVCVNIIFKL